jgi:enhanced filamentous growth protein 1
MQSYGDVHPPHMSATTAHVPSTGAPSLNHYQQYQPPILQPGPPSQYPSQPGYGQYSYSNGVGQPSAGQPVTSSMNAGMVQHSLPLPPRK